MTTNFQPLVMLATYNEAGNIENIYSMLRGVVPSADILFVDDNSPDGTGQLIDMVIGSDAKAFVIHRPEKLGIGSAHRDGINWAYNHGYGMLVTMDCDMAHSPSLVPQFLEAALTYDVVVGTRFQDKDALPRWSIHRRFLTHFGHFLTMTLLKMPQDATGAFRSYNLAKIPREYLDRVGSNGYSFLFESLHILHFNGFNIMEVPIVLPARTYGESKMRIIDVIGGVRDLLRQSYKFRFKKSELRIANDPGNTPKDWDRYWAEQNNAETWGFYEKIAGFYRIKIIRPSLKAQLAKSFLPGERILHAGCGSGMVDTDVVGIYDITACDFSPQALAIYSNFFGERAKTVKADLFESGFENAGFDGLYNLGVMEHFSASEMDKILKEFHRILKPGGRIVLFWPPEFGLSVMVLRFVHFVLNDILGRNIHLHPAEPSRIKSRRQVRELLQKNGFKLERFDFGIHDLFTHAVVHAVRAEL